MVNRNIQLLREGDELAFKTVFEQFSGRIYKLAFRFLKDKVQSEEIVQEVFIKLWLNREKLDPTGDLWLYLYVIGKRLCLNALKEIIKSESLVKNLLENIEEEYNLLEEQITANDTERFIDDKVEKLPKQQQTIFKLSRKESLSHSEIALKLNISQNTVKNHMVKALKTLKDAIPLLNFLFI
jgi:RNA polymerase sigma-70 factor (family 1)